MPIQSNWIHIDFFFHKEFLQEGKLYEDKFILLKNLLSTIYMRYMLYCGKCFYLFEPNPHLFFAFELKTRDHLATIKKIFNDIKLTQGRIYEKTNKH